MPLHSALAGSALLLLALAAPAAPIAVDFSGTVDFMREDEYGMATPIPPGAVSLLPLFQGATRVQGRYVYDAAGAVDLDPGNAGLYVAPGSLSVALPELGLTFNATGQLSFVVYPGITRHEFQVNSGGSGYASTGHLGGGVLFGLSMTFFGAALPDDRLPSGPDAWDYANLHINLAGVAPPRDLFIAFAPVPEPAPGALAAGGLLAIALLRRRLRP